MSLDSSDTISGAAEGNRVSDELSSSREKKKQSDSNWVFLFTHRIKLDKVNEILNRKFETFVHRTIVYQRRAQGKTVKKELPTVSGLIFIRGAADEVQKYLNDTFSGIYLVKDFSRGKVAEISNKEMNAFMKLSAVDEEKVRFMLNPLDYYADGHQRIRITSGDLKGCEGYIVRIHRDRKLITQIGNMTVAIGGISKESLENADEFVESRRNNADTSEANPSRSPLEQEINQYFFTPTNDLEAMAIAKNLEPLTVKLRKEVFAGDTPKGVDGVFLTLSEIADRFSAKYFKNESVGINDVCVNLINILKESVESHRIKEDIKQQITTDLESLMLRHPVLPVDEVLNASA